MILTVTLSPTLDKFYWLRELPPLTEATEAGMVLRAEKSLASAGGKGINVSVFLAGHGVETVAMGFLAGRTGELVLGDVLASGVTANFVWIEGETRTNVSVIVRGQEYHPLMIHESGPPVPQAAWEVFLHKYEVMLKRATHVVLAGALPPGLDPEVNRELARRARARGVPVVVHTGRDALLQTFPEKPFLVKPDVREELEIGGRPVATKEEAIAAGRWALDQGVEHCLISHRITGDILINRDGIWEFEAKVPLSTFHNLVGADDALVGGILVGISQGKDLLESVKYGMAAAVASAEVEEKLCLDQGRILAEMERVSIKRSDLP